MNSYGRLLQRIARRRPAVSFNSVEELRQALVNAKDAHTQYEKENGPDENWPLWYAKHIADRTQLAEVKSTSE